MMVPAEVVSKVEAWLGEEHNVQSLQKTYAAADRQARELTERSRTYRDVFRLFAPSLFDPRPRIIIHDAG